MNQAPSSHLITLADATGVVRDIVFISKATPGDDDFVLWLAPRLEDAGYTVFADILNLDPGDRWRKVITSTLQNRAIKMLVCCRDTTLAKDNVQEEIGIALDLAKELPDPKFIIPLRLETYKKVLGIGELQYIDFVRGWADGLDRLLETLKRQNIPCDPTKVRINPNWEIYRRRGSVPIKEEPERLTSNWLRVAEAPDVVRYFEPSGAADLDAMASACASSTYPAQPMQRGFVSFGTRDEINEAFASTGRFDVKAEIPLMEFIAKGAPQYGIQGKDASNVIVSMFRQAWNAYCRDKNLREYVYSKAVGFHCTVAQAEVGQKIPWGKQGDRRSSMLRNIAKGQVWAFGVSAVPAFWPFPHFKLKSRVLFAPPLRDDAGDPFDDKRKQHRLRRSVCKGWRNKQWHGRLMAFIEMLSGDSASIVLPLGASATIRLEAAPILFSSPISTALPNVLADEDEEQDDSTLGRPEPEEEEP